jgi:hypothetical protein
MLCLRKDLFINKRYGQLLGDHPASIEQNTDTTE